MEMRPLFGLTPDVVDEDFVYQMIEGYELPRMTFKRLSLLAILLYINGINKKSSDGCFFLSNRCLMKISGFKNETNLIIVLRKLSDMGLIERKSGDVGVASTYRISIKKSSDTAKNSSTDIYSRYTSSKISRSKVTGKQLKEKIKKEKQKQAAVDLERVVREQRSEISSLRRDVSLLRKQLSSLLSSIEGIKSGSVVEYNAAGGSETTCNTNHETGMGQNCVSLNENITENTSSRQSRVKKTKSKTTHNLNDCKKKEKRIATQEEREAGRLLNKFNNNQLTYREYERLLQLKECGVLTPKQIRMMFAISKREKPKDKISLYCWANKEWDNGIDEWIERIGVLLNERGGELNENIIRVMRSFSNKVSIKYDLLEGHKVDSFNFLKSYYYRTLDRWEEAGAASLFYGY